MCACLRASVIIQEEAMRLKENGEKVGVRGRKGKGENDLNTVIMNEILPKKVIKNIIKFRLY